MSLLLRITIPIALSPLVIPLSSSAVSLGIPIQKLKPVNTPQISLKLPVRLPIFYDDTSFLRFVSKDTSLSNASYIPSNLVSISGSTINEAGRRSQLRQEARDALWQMSSEFQQEFGTPLTVVSGYRSAAYQQRLWDLGRCSDSLCAPPGYSEHQLGLAVDLFEASNEKEFFRNQLYTRYYRWLSQNAHLYGWTQSYQK